MKMNNDLEKAVYNLLWVWYQYNHIHKSTEDYFSHACMGAGENAAQFLERMGYGHDDGWGFVLNQKAKDLMAQELEMEED